ncbi:hypothetical protein BDP27DRAFT_1443514 [Rhodocollybia butyracea]|uniref:Uncharacterized protein n=1 Tax=Rhodocollybia butyracea TaxID=206335 RepID=A0A9P5UDX5_9AGAR|nr:hypothetical protein BDP27DRAFT_1443514 [Rhodocollybia butyracea]
MFDDYPAPSLLRLEQMGLVQWLNLVNEGISSLKIPFQRYLIGEMSRRVRFLLESSKHRMLSLFVRPLSDLAPISTTGPRAAQTMDKLDVTLAAHERRLTQMSESYQELSEKDLIEARHALRETAVCIL